jgi:hypothetical protein
MYVFSAGDQNQALELAVDKCSTTVLQPPLPPSPVGFNEVWKSIDTVSLQLTNVLDEYSQLPEKVFKIDCHFFCLAMGLGCLPILEAG